MYVVLLIVCLYAKIFWSYTADIDNHLFMYIAFSWLFYYYAENMDTIPSSFILYLLRWGVPFALFLKVVEGVWASDKFANQNIKIKMKRERHRSCFKVICTNSTKRYMIFFFFAQYQLSLQYFFFNIFNLNI